MLFKFFDSDGRGDIDFEEFLQGVKVKTLWREIHLFLVCMSDTLYVSMELLHITFECTPLSSTYYTHHNRAP